MRCRFHSRYIAALFLTTLMSVFLLAGCGAGDDSFETMERLAIDRLKAIAAAQESYKSGNLSGENRFATLVDLEATGLIVWPIPGVYEKDGYIFADIIYPNYADWGVYAAPLEGTKGRYLAITMQGEVRASNGDSSPADLMDVLHESWPVIE